MKSVSCQTFCKTLNLILKLNNNLKGHENGFLSYNLDGFMHGVRFNLCFGSNLCCSTCNQISIAWC